MKIIEFLHEETYSGETNLDLWIHENKGWVSEKLNVNRQQEFPKYESFDLLILHGGAQHLWDKVHDSWLEAEVAFVRETLKRQKPVVGFCLGSQIIAEALYGVVFKAEQKEVGWVQILPLSGASDHSLMKGLEQGFESFLWHWDHFSLPQHCCSLAFTKLARNQLFFSLQVPAVGIQFHPEYTKEMIEYYIKNYYEELIEGTNDSRSTHDLLEELQGKPDNYRLFKQLMDNSLEWFKQKFEFTTDEKKRKG